MGGGRGQREFPRARTRDRGRERGREGTGGQMEGGMFPVELRSSDELSGVDADSNALAVIHFV